MKSEQVGARVKEMRKALGMKQDELFYYSFVLSRGVDNDLF